MKQYLYTLLFASVFLFFSCEMKKDIFGEGNKGQMETTTEDQGLLDLELQPQKEADIPESKGGVTGSDVVVIDVNEFAVDILDANGIVVEHYNSYADLKNEGGLMLPGGNYTIRATLGDDVNAGFDKPFYLGTNVCEITPQEVAKVITDCVLSNKKVTFRCSDGFLKKFEDDYSIVVNNNAGALTTNKEETRVSYLKNTGVLQFTVYATLKNGSRTLVYNYDMSKNEQVQQYNNILVDLDLVEDTPPTDPDEPDEPADPGDPEQPGDSATVKAPAIKVDISLIEKEFVIEVPSVFVDAGDSGDTPGGDDNPGDDTVAKPTIVGDAGLDISQPIEISGAGNKTVRVKINTPGKLTSLVVKITSSTLESLLPAVGLTSEFDICDESLKETLSKLGLSATKGAPSTTFDISSFMPMIAGLGGGDYLFTITATDQLGQNASKTLTIRNLND